MSQLHLAVALDGAGWHPAAWQEATARPRELLTAQYWVDLVTRARAGLLDLVTIEDSLALQSTDLDAPDGRVDRVRGRLDAVLIAARTAPLVDGIGLVPSIIATHTEPFHISKAIATLDYVSNGRAGVRVQVSPRPYEAELFGRREFGDLAAALAGGVPPANLVADLLAEASDHIEVQRRLWDSWQDDAEIRDIATGRFIDRDRLHYIDFEGRWFAVKGPSITPRPPQGQPPVLVLAHTSQVAAFGGRVADVVVVTPQSAEGIAEFAGAVAQARIDAGRDAETVHVFADVAVALDGAREPARDRLARLDEAAALTWTGDDVPLLQGSASEIADVLAEWQRHGVTGFRLRPATLPVDLELISGELVPELQRRKLFRTAYAGATLRDRLGLPRPVNRYQVAANGSVR